MFERIKKYYTLGLWTESMVQSAVQKSVITKEEYNQILKGKQR